MRHSKTTIAQVRGTIRCVAGQGVAMARLINLLVIENQRLNAEVLARSLSQQEGIGTVSYAPILEALAMARSRPVDILLLGESREIRDVVNVVARIKFERPNVNVVPYGLDDDVESIVRLIVAGASGYVLKGASFAKLLDTIYSVDQGKVTCSPRIAASVFALISQLAFKNSQSESARPSRLGRREVEVFELITRGLGNKEIAGRLCLSVSTVRNHVHSIFKKLNLHCRREALRYGRGNGLSRASWPLPPDIGAVSPESNPGADAGLNPI